MERSRDEIIKYIQGMPEDSTIDDIMESLHFKKKVERGLKDIEAGRTLSHEAVKDRMAEWAKSIGH